MMLSVQKQLSSFNSALRERTAWNKGAVDAATLQGDEMKDLIPDRLLPMVELNDAQKQQLKSLDRAARRACLRPTLQNLAQLRELMKGLPKGEMPSAELVDRLNAGLQTELEQEEQEAQEEQEEQEEQE